MSNRNSTILDKTLKLNPHRFTTLSQHLKISTRLGINQVGHHLANHVSAFKRKPKLSQQQEGHEILFTSYFTIKAGRTHGIDTQSYIRILETCDPSFQDCM